MDDFSLILLGAAVVLGLPIVAISAFVMVVRLKSRVGMLEAKVRGLEMDLNPGSSRAAPASSSEATPTGTEAREDHGAADGEATPGAAPSEPETQADPVPDFVPEPIMAREPDAEPAPAAAPAPAAPARRRAESLEEKLGARWAVWVGGLALALGGIFLVRYSIEAGLIGPGARILLGLIFSIGLLAAGEFLRRREPQQADAGERRVHIPGVVTAAGIAALFATVYAAHALYGFIGSATAFIALGAVGIGAIFAAALHGPWLAALGLVGAYATPVLVSSTAPNPFALAAYLLIVTAATFILARMRRWRWLAIVAAVAAMIWGFLIVLLPIGADAAANAAYILALAALVLAIIVVEPHRRNPLPDRFDGLALGTLAAAAALAIAFAAQETMSALSLGVGIVVAAAFLAVALALDAVAPAAALSALTVLGLLLVWPIAQEIAAEPVLVIPNHMALQPVTPDALAAYLALAALAGAALFAMTTARIAQCRNQPVPPALALALAGVFGPLTMLALAYLRTTGFTQSFTFGAVAVATAAILCVTGERLLRQEGGAAVPAHGAAGAIHIAGAAAALALALTMLMEGSQLTLAFALAALGCTLVAERLPLAALRWSAAAFAILVLVRIGGAWTVIGEALSTYPGWGDIALRYALPALALGYGGVVLRRRATDQPAAILDGASIVLLAAAAALAVRLWVRGPEGAFSAEFDLVEAGLDIAIAFAIALGLARAALLTQSPVHRIAAPPAALGAGGLALLGLVFGLNPVMTGEDVTGGQIVNSLLPAYALPALLAGACAATWWRIAGAETTYPAPLAKACARLSSAAALALAFVYVTLETRVLVSGPDMSFADIPTAESYAYSAVWLAFGIVLLAAGLLLGSKGARLASALVIMLAVAKVFLIDMSDLEGVWRALSFIGLGAVLIGIGLIYQRLLFGGARQPADPPQTT